MTGFHVFLVLFLQAILICAEENVEESIIESTNTTEQILDNDKETNTKEEKFINSATKHWMHMFLGPNSTFYPSSSAAMMAQVTNTNKTAEQQIEDIKEVANKICDAIQGELANLLTGAMVHKDPTEDNKLRKRRSVESPLDSTKLVMRLLKHIKSNNEYQNIAIEKMMTAQEIADKYGIEFTPDTNVLSDLALAANNHATELTTLLKDACTPNQCKKEDVQFIPCECTMNEKPHNHTYYVYSIYPEETPYVTQNKPGQIEIELNLCNDHHNHQHNVETQMSKPPVQNIPVTPKPTYYETLTYPHQEIYYDVDPAPKTVLLPGEDDFEPEPILTGEEFEETITSKVYIDHENEKGDSTVNHVTTYTIAEKSHFKKPEIEKLPEHMQYCFLLL